MWLNAFILSPLIDLALTPRRVQSSLSHPDTHILRHGQFWQIQHGMFPMPQTQDQGTRSPTTRHGTASVLILLWCDETRPQCKKCVQNKKPCPGYPFSIGLQLRNTEPPPFKRQDSSLSLAPSLIRHDSSTSSAYLPVDHECATPLLTPVVSQNEPVMLCPDCFYPSAPQEWDLLQVNHELLPVQKSLLTLTSPSHRSLITPPKYDFQH